MSKEPKDWFKVYNKIKEYRSLNEAPIDLMQCSGNTLNIDEKEYRFRVLVTLILSSRTKDETTLISVKNLMKFNNDKLNCKLLFDMTIEQIDKCISKVAFHFKKAEYLKEMSKVCIDEYNEDIPDNVDDLMKLKGVGPKMAYLTIQCAWDKNIGIGVDTHVNRICNRLKWTKSDDSEKTRKELEDWLPEKYWKEINFLFVGFGQTICKARPKCIDCPINDLCPSSNIRSGKIKKRKKE